MKKLRKVDKEGKDIYGALLKYKKKTCCRTCFKKHVKCDIVENNMRETFNSWTSTPISS